ncbi:MAG: DUF4097 family beta strand repeat protein [Solirubrobacterales bacterium]|nr:DUF4097 family beta strand repeat protein [Solirubrobacterales bacterium]
MRPRRRLAIVAVAIAAALSLLLGLVVMFGGVGSALASTERDTTVIRKPARRVVIAVGSGDVTVFATGTKREIRVSRESKRFLVGPRITETVRGGVVRLKSDCPLPLPGPCQTSYRVEVPRGVSLMAKSTAGNVRVEGIRGPIRAESTAGNVDVSGGRSRSVQARSTAGNVAVRLRSRPDRITAKSTAGNVDVQVPHGTYSIEAATTAGDQSVTGLVDDPDARRRIMAKTTAGNAAVRAR